MAIVVTKNLNVVLRTWLKITNHGRTPAQILSYEIRSGAQGGAITITHADGEGKSELGLRSDRRCLGKKTLMKSVRFSIYETAVRHHLAE